MPRREALNAMNKDPVNDAGSKRSRKAHSSYTTPHFP
jgi:hypothetical protein